MGATVYSNSWGYHLDPPTTDVVNDALHTVATESRNHRGATVLFAMHNSAVDDCKARYPDISAHLTLLP